MSGAIEPGPWLPGFFPFSYTKETAVFFLFVLFFYKKNVFF